MLLNKERAIAYLDQCGLDAVVATSPVNITYLTDYSCWLSPLLKGYMTEPGGSSELGANYAVFARDGEGGLVIGSAFATNVRACWVNRLRFGGPLLFDRTPLLESPPEARDLRECWELFTERDCDESPDAGLAELLKEMGLANARLGVEMEDLSARRKSELGETLKNCEVRDCSNLLRLIRMVKTDQELRRVARSAEINERALLAGLREAQAGMSALELIRNYRIAIAANDASLDHYAYSIDGLGIATQGDYTLRDGDVMFIDSGCIFEYQFSDTGTTLFVGSAPGELVAHFSALGEAVDAGQAAATVGATASSVHKVMASVIDGHGLASPIHGHSLGLDVREYPMVLPSKGGRISDDCVDVDADIRLEPGMVFNIEAPLFLPPTGAFQLEKTFVMTDQGCKPLIEQDRTGPVIGA
jgi:Xaa-Pro dipeptidase